MAVREIIKIKPLAAPRQITVTVGVHGDEGAAPHANDTGAALTVADVAMFHEFGLGVPQRSFVRAWFDESQPFLQETMRSQMKLVVAGKITAEVAMNRIALAFEGSIKQRIAKGIGPPLAKSTIAAKGSSKPLIDSGQLRAAVRAKGVLSS